jgi:hypothetical protein
MIETIKDICGITLVVVATITLTFICGVMIVKFLRDEL